MLSKITIQDKFGNEGFYIFTDAIEPEKQKTKIEGICYRDGTKVNLSPHSIEYWKWFVWFLDYRMWIDGVEWDKSEQQRKQEDLQRTQDAKISEQRRNISEQRRKGWAKQEHDRIIDMGLDRSDADGNL